MHASVTVPMAAPADEIWNIVSDVRNTGKFSPEVIEAEWLDGTTGSSAGRPLPRTCASQRDRPCLLDDMPRHRLRPGPRVRLRGACRRHAR